MKYEVIEQSKSEYPVKRLCVVLGVSESGYYAWLKREPSQRALQDSQLRQKIVSIWQQFRGIYGAPRIHAELLAQGLRLGLKRVARLMREAGIHGKMARRKRPRTTQIDRSQPIAPNLLNRQFDVQQAHQVWLSDITYIDTAEGYLYAAAVLDLGSREIVGLAMADHMRTELTLTALEMAVLQQQPDPGLMHHSDRGSQYTSSEYQQKLTAYNMIPSMSRTGNCLDNAPMESFWATLKRECADEQFASHHAARTAIFQYVMGFYNRTRRHSSLGYETPLTYAA
jgi:putative transposase